MKIGYLGPQGTFSEQAAIAYTKDFDDCQRVCYPTINEVLMAVEKGEISEGVVPFENSIEGTVTGTIDTLIFDVNLNITSEIIIPIRQNLLVSKNYTGDKITKIMSHHQGLAQCRHFLNDNYPDCVLEPVNSTAESARIVAESDTNNIAGIAPLRAAEIFDVRVLDKDIQDDTHNETRFIVISKKAIDENHLNEKTSFALSIEHRPGELYKILDIISIWDLNMTKIESRPMKNQLGRYVFLIDVETDNKDDLKDCIKMLRRKTSFFKLLGSYPVYSKNEG